MVELPPTVLYSIPWPQNTSKNWQHPEQGSMIYLIIVEMHRSDVPRGLGSSTNVDLLCKVVMSPLGKSSRHLRSVQQLPAQSAYASRNTISEVYLLPARYRIVGVEKYLEILCAQQTSVRSSPETRTPFSRQQRNERSPIWQMHLCLGHFPSLDVEYSALSAET